MCTNWQMDKLLSHKNEQTADDIRINHSEKSRFKKLIPYDSIYKILWKKHSYWDRNQTGGCQGLSVGEKH